MSELKAGYHARKLLDLMQNHDQELKPLTILTHVHPDPASRAPDRNLRALETQSPPPAPASSSARRIRPRPEVKW